MKNNFKKIILSPLFWTIPIYFAIIWLMPPFYQKFNLELVRTENNTDKKIFYEDLDSDGYSEKIISENKFDFNNFIFKNEKDSIVAFFSIKNSTTDNELCKFEDYNQNGLLEFYFFTISNDSIFLSAIEYKNPPTYIFKHKFITTIDQNYKGEYDISTNDNPIAFDMNNDGYKEIYFFISAGYSYFPRKVFAYDIVNDTVYSSPESGAKLMTPEFFDFENDNSPELYFKTYATDNYDSLTDKSNYPDTSAWLMILDKNLKFLFEPIEFTPRGTKTQTFPIKNTKKDDFDILVLKTSFVASHTPTIAYIYDIKGNLIRKKELAEISNMNISLIENKKDYSKIFFIDEFGYLYIYNNDLIFEKKQKIINLKNSEQISIGAYDIDNNGEIEYLFWHQSGMTVTDKNFKHPVFVPLENSGLEFPSIIKSIDGNTYFWYKTVNNTWYMLKYSKNPQYFYRYFIFIGIFVALFVIIYTLMTLRSKKLEDDYKKLNKIVNDRTREITEQKEELDKLNQKLFANFKKTEQQNIKINIQNTKLKGMYKELQNLSKFREMNTQMIVHDLKNPLNRIISTTKEKNKQLKDSAQFMLNLVENILSVSKIEQNKLAVDIQQINLNNNIRQAYEETEFLFKNKGIEFKCNLKENYTILADFEVLKRIFVNLFTNAIKYTSSGGKVIVKTKINKNKIEIFVEDNGIGISKNNIDVIFEIYRYNKTGNYQRVSSSGIGLFFVKNALEAHGSKINVVSTNNIGSVFSFKLDFVSSSRRIEEKTSEPVSLSSMLIDREKVFVKYTIDKLKKVEIYEVSEIKTILSELKSDNVNILKWKEEILDSVSNFNSAKYYKLISILK